MEEIRGVEHVHDRYGLSDLRGGWLSYCSGSER